MKFRRFFPAINLLKINTLTQQARFFVRDPFPNKLTHYFHRAKLIDSIRLALRSNSPDSLIPLLNTRLLDSFVVTHALRSAPSAHSALSLIQTLETLPHFQHSQGTFDALATVLSKFRLSTELKSLICAVDSGRFNNVRVSFMSLMRWYATSGDLDAVLSTWDHYRREDKRPCTEAYNIVMHLYAQTSKNSEAVEIFHGMIKEGAFPNCRTYTIVIEHLVSLGKLDSAMEVFSMLPLMRIKPTLKQFSVLVEAFAGAERFNEVKALLKEMQDNGIFPGRAMQLSLHRMKEAGYVEEVNEFLKEMLPDERIRNISYFEDGSDEDEEEDDKDSSKDRDEDGNRNGVKLKPWLDPKALADALKEWNPEVVAVLEDAKFVWTPRLVRKVLRNFRSAETAWDFFCWIACQPGFTHDFYTVQRMMTILARHGQVELVDKILTKLRLEGRTLPFSTTRLLIDFYGISKNADAALNVFRDDKTLCGPISKFNLTLLYSSLLRTLTKCQRNSEALDILEEMILRGVNPDIQTFSGLIYHFARQRDIITVQKLFAMVRQSSMEPDAHLFKVVIQAYCKCERAALAWRVFEDMRNSNLMPDAATKELLVKSLCNEGRRREAANVEEIYEEMSEQIKEVLPLELRGHIWTVSPADIMRVYNIYSRSFTSNTA